MHLWHSASGILRQLFYLLIAQWWRPLCCLVAGIHMIHVIVIAETLALSVVMSEIQCIAHINIQGLWKRTSLSSVNRYCIKEECEWYPPSLFLPI